MTTIKSKYDLKTQTDAYVSLRDEVYVRIGTEYVRKHYFSATEAKEILGLKHYELHRLAKELGMQAPVNRRKRLRITMKQLRQMATMNEQ